jgi:hypothetical protein
MTYPLFGFYKSKKILIGSNSILTDCKMVSDGMIDVGNNVINQDVTVGSGSVITKSLSTSVFAAGVLAKVIQKKDVKRLSTERKHIIALETLPDFHEYALHYLKLNRYDWIELDTLNAIDLAGMISKKDSKVFQITLNIKLFAHYQQTFVKSKLFVSIGMENYSCQLLSITSPPAIYYFLFR